MYVATTTRAVIKAKIGSTFLVLTKNVSDIKVWGHIFDFWFSGWSLKCQIPFDSGWEPKLSRMSCCFAVVIL